MKKFFLLAMIFAYCTQTMVAQTITEGSRWWNGERLYTAHVDRAEAAPEMAEAVESSQDWRHR